jgi:hypothetical protein
MGMAVSGRKVQLGVLSVPSTSFTSDVVLEAPGGSVTLSFEFRRGTERYRGGVRFDKVRAYRFRAEGHCTAWHVEGAYDTIAEVTGSDWVGELAAAEPAQTWGSWETRHFMIYIDSAGCYEVAAQSWSLVPEERIE